MSISYSLSPSLFQYFKIVPNFKFSNLNCRSRPSYYSSKPSEGTESTIQPSSHSSSTSTLHPPSASSPTMTLSPSSHDPSTPKPDPNQLRPRSPSPPVPLPRRLFPLIEESSLSSAAINASPPHSPPHSPSPSSRSEMIPPPHLPSSPQLSSPIPYSTTFSVPPSDQTPVSSRLKNENDRCPPRSGSPPPPQLSSPPPPRCHSLSSHISHLEADIEELRRQNDNLTCTTEEQSFCMCKIADKLARCQTEVNRLANELRGLQKEIKFVPCPVDVEAKEEDDSFLISWKSPPSPRGYEMELNGESLGSFEGRNGCVQLEGLPPGSHRIRIRALRARSASAFSAPLTIHKQSS